MCLFDRDRDHAPDPGIGSSITGMIGTLRGLREASLVVLLVFGLGFMGNAEAAPVALDQQQFNTLVDTISRGVIAKLQAEGLVVLAAPPTAVSTAADSGKGADASSFIARSKVIFAAYPALGSALARLPASLDEAQANGWGLPAFAAVLGAIVATAYGVERVARLLVRPARRWVIGRVLGPPGLQHVGAVAILDCLALLGVWVVSSGARELWFSGADPQSRLATLILAGFFSWRLSLFAFRIFLRPDLPAVRLADMPNPDAEAIYGRVAVAILVVLAARTATQFLEVIDTPRDAIAAGTLVNDVIGLAVFTWAAVGVRTAVAGWFTRLAATPADRGLGGALARHWLVVALPFFSLLAAANAFGAVSARRDVPSALLMTLNIAVGLLLLETLLGFVGRTAFPETVRAGLDRPRAFDLFARCLRMAALVVAGVTVAETWIVNVLGLVGPEQWHLVARSGFRAGVTIFMAYVAWQVIGFVAERYAGADGNPGATEGNETATRFATLIPLIKVVLGGTISMVALLVVLSESGVNITPLLAGASVFGLAISFGSQTLVKDVVSGVFYLADDAFRVGEYIDCGKAKGTVEGFTMRSIRLRHQNGPMHTIPFGELGQITNFSRGWSVVKFNLRFARDTDLDALRKLVKRIGLEMMDDPDMKAELTQPLKMMGVAEITDNALVIRFKFTVRPNNPGMVQREAMIRMVQAFPDAGIQFSNGIAPVPPPSPPGVVEPPGPSAPALHALLPAA